MWLTLLILALGSASAVSEQRHYVFTAPKAFLVGSEERMCLTLFDTPETGDLTVEVFGEPEAPPLSEFKLSVSGVAGGSKQTCFDVDIPATSRYMGRVDISVVFPATFNYSIKGSREVTFKKLDNEMTFVQTDKSLYKPGQLVQFRVLTVTGSLTPVTLPLESVYIESPGRTRLAQWRNVSAPGGLVQLQFQLSEEPTLGLWTITVKSASGKRTRKTFKVETYVLPKFSVEIKGPPFVVGDDKEVEWKICGIYTYGKPVAGQAVLNVTSGYRKTLVATKTARTDDDGGCARVRFSQTDLGLGQYGRSRHSFSLSATLQEDDTDVTLSASLEQQVHYQRLKLTAGDQGTKFFKPGIAYFDQIAVTNPDSSPAGAGVLVELCYKVQNKDDDEDDRSYWNIWSDLKGATCRNLTSDSKGLVKFGVPPQDPKVHGIRIRARTPEYPETKYPATEWGYEPIYMRTPQLNINMQGWFSESGSFLQLSKQIDKRFSCGAIAEIPVYFTTKLNSKFRVHYQVISQGNIQMTDSVAVDFNEVSNRDLEVDEGYMIAAAADRSNETMPVGETTLNIPVTSALSTGFKVIAYLVVDGEVVADGRGYQAEPCLGNRVGLQWSQSTVRPKQELSLSLQAAPGSICGIDVVDKSVNLLSSENRITISSIFSILKKYNLGKYEGISQVQDHTYCREKYGEPNLEQESGPETTSESKRSTWIPHRPHSYWKSVFVDSLSAFDSSSVAVLTNLLLETRTCSLKQRQFYPAMAFEAHNLGGGVPGPGTTTTVWATSTTRAPTTFTASAGIGAAVEEDEEPSAVPETVRTYFPETWLFDLYTVGEDGSVTVTQEAPDTITEWVAGAVCSSNTAGMGVAPAASFTTFQPFFISYTLPYSVKRGEQLRLKVSVFNYEAHSLPMKLTLIDSDQFELQSDQVQTACVLPARPQVITFLLRPSDLGQVNLTVVAEVYPEYPEQCGPQTVLAFQDAVTRPILVEPEGYLREMTRSSFMCLSPENNELSGNTDDPDVTWPLTLPDDLVPDSERAEVAVVGDLLGPSIENLESLVRLPTGCGEQNMVKFAPNIHVMKYLTAVGELSESLKQKLSEYMKTGYQRELTYRHPDYSYSAFGSRDDSGSMWLTAFVLRSFSQAADFIYVDREDLQKSVGWIEQQQQRLSGCFPRVGRVLHKGMKGGVASGNEATLTAYVTASLISSGVKLEEGTLKNAFRCLQDDGSSDLYTLVLRAYAYALSGHTKEARIDFDTLMSKAQKRGGLIWWENEGSGDNKALSVELGSYVILIANLLRKDADVKDSESYFSSALGAVRWISEQRNSKGGFVSTQDTVLALEALAEFSADLPRSEQMNLNVFISDHERMLNTVAVNRGNRLLAQKTAVSQLPSQLHITASGVGCALVQATLRYNVITATPSDAMKITISSKPKSGQKECLKHELDLCVSYLKEDSSNMAIVELAMVSGFIPNKSSLKMLEKNQKLGLKRWELVNNRLVLYFDSLEAEPRCFGLTVQREEQVDDVKPAVVSVIDYYQPEFSISTSYSLDVECTTEPIFRPIPVPLPAIDGFVDQLDAAAAGNAGSSTAATPLESPSPPPSSSMPFVAGVTP